ncbi:hypothetical protein BKA67DRAFT_542246 [Truncatella angustata]|uniref:Uncharacterized protein n=1 Tax=Truncatella angustata TaxID=152316 RepID=A0A9P8UAC8_9PEZI|nr:uncharacterized protein BKA67DRAFT_542246 [Truncatella angustata]KAH6643286.1 hypothetical protein BKA67DRAFT_542246 [Truncatella angustata]
MSAQDDTNSHLARITGAPINIPDADDISGGLPDILDLTSDQYLSPVMDVLRGIDVSQHMSNCIRNAIPVIVRQGRSDTQIKESESLNPGTTSNGPHHVEREQPKIPGERLLEALAYRAQFDELAVGAHDATIGQLAPIRYELANTMSEIESKITYLERRISSITDITNESENAMTMNTGSVSAGKNTGQLVDMINALNPTTELERAKELYRERAKLVTKALRTMDHIEVLSDHLVTVMGPMMDANFDEISDIGYTRINTDC